MGNGVGAVLLKRLDDALADRDTIKAVICGYGMNNDGGDKVGYAAPSVSGQANAIATALATADLEPTDIGYVEAHGTGTALGDPIEVAALREVFDVSTDRRQYCGLGSLKSNIGHLNEAAGIASLIKVVTSIEAGVIFPSLHVEKPNPMIGFEESSFFIPTAAMPWPGPGPRRACQLVRCRRHKRAPRTGTGSRSRTRRPVTGQQVWPVLVSARNRDSLTLQCADLARAFDSDVDLADAAYSLAVGREMFEYRFACVAGDSRAAARALESSAPLEPRPVDEVIFSFGAGTMPPPDAVRELSAWHPSFRTAWQECEEAAAPLGLTLAVADGAWEPSAACAFQYSLARLWAAHGLYPTGIVGVGDGDYAAAAFTQEISLGEALRRVSEGTSFKETTEPAEPGAGLWISMTQPHWIGVHGRRVETGEPASGPVHAVAASLAEAWAAGAEIRWEPLFAPLDCGRIPLPGYRFKTESYWSHTQPEHPAGLMPDGPSAAASFAGPVSDEEAAELVASAWAKALGKPPASPDEDFYDAGGDSLAALELVATLDASLGIEVQVDDIFSAPALDALTAKILAQLGASGRSTNRG